MTSEVSQPTLLPVSLRGAGKLLSGDRESLQIVVRERAGETLDVSGSQDLGCHSVSMSFGLHDPTWRVRAGT